MANNLSDGIIDRWAEEAVDALDPVAAAVPDMINITPA